MRAARQGDLHRERWITVLEVHTLLLEWSMSEGQVEGIREERLETGPEAACMR